VCIVRSVSPQSPSARLVEEVVTLLGGPAKAAAALKVTRQHISRVLSGGSALGVVATVRAAIIVGRNPVKALRDVGEDDAADVLPQGFGAPVTRTQRTLLEKIDALPPAIRRHILGLISEWSAE
jgi:hypothetical protein